MVDKATDLTYQEALKDLLEYWQTHMIDEENGGFRGRIDGYGKVHVKSEKGLVMNTRVLWTFAKAYNTIGNETYLNVAKRAYDYLNSYFVDQESGGLYWMLDYQGNVVNSKKQIYGQAFAIYAYSEYYKATGNEDALNGALSLFDLIEKHSFDDQRDGYLEAFQANWTLIEDLRLSEKDVNAAKTMNTHLHILEAYTTLHAISKSEQVKQKLVNLIQLIHDKFYDERGYFNLFYNEVWESQSDERSYGHDIESAWLIYEAAMEVGEEKIDFDPQSFVLQIADATLPFVDADGGLFYEGNSFGVTNDEKHWWPQMESMIGYTLAYELSKNKLYRQTVDRHWKFVTKNLIDIDKGEWYWGVNKNGLPLFSEDKAGPWKGPYHNGRALMILAEKL